MQRVLFIVGGFGLGNATRCESLLREFERRGLSVDVASSGNAHWYFSSLPQNPVKIQLRSLSYGVRNGEISLSSTLLSLPALLKDLMRNAFAIWRLQRKQQYDLLVVDSEYSVFPIKWLMRAPVLALNNVFFTALLDKQSEAVRPVPTKYLERLDHFVQSTCADFYVSPVLDPQVVGEQEKLLFCPPLIRPDLKTSSATSCLQRALVVMSGSGLGADAALVNELARIPSITSIVVLGMSGQNLGKVSYLGKQSAVSECIEEADFIVSAGGFSSLSEAIVCRKPLMMIPLKNHYEQDLNTQCVERLNLGVIAQQHSLFEAYQVLQQKILQMDWTAPLFTTPGAVMAVDFVLRQCSPLKAIDAHV